MKYIMNSLLLGVLLLAGCKDYNSTAHVLIIGDSWGQLMCVFNSFPKVMESMGYSKSDQSISCLETSRAKTKARTWSTESELNKIMSTLDAHPQIKYIYISLGGNDFFEIWNKNISESDKHAAFKQVQDNLIKIIQTIRKKNGQARIVLSSYDYSNFQYLMDTQFVDAYVQIYTHMNEPTAAEMHLAINELEKYKQELTTMFDNVFYVNVQGVMQHQLGVPDLNIKPGELPMPEQGPHYTPGGRYDLWNPRQAFIGIPYTKYYDPYHLNTLGFVTIVQTILKNVPVQ